MTGSYWGSKGWSPCLRVVLTLWCMYALEPLLTPPPPSLHLPEDTFAPSPDAFPILLCSLPYRFS